VLLDRAFLRALRNFSTLFLTVAVVTVTLHLVYSLVFKDVLAVSELHPEIERLRPSVKLQHVGPRELSFARNAYWVLIAIEIALLPLLIGAAHRIMKVESDGGVPTVVDAYRHAEIRLAFSRLDRGGWLTVLVAAGIALLMGYLFERAGLLLTEIVPDDWLFLAAGLVRGLSRAVAVPFFLAAVVVAGNEAGTRRSGS
jgi:hypothetical protein